MWVNIREFEINTLVLIFPNQLGIKADNLGLQQGSVTCWIGSRNDSVMEQLLTHHINPN